MKRIAILLVLGFLAVGTANADIVPFLSSGPIVDGSNFDFNYTANLSGDERLDPVATNGVTCPGASGALVQCNPAGTFFTIYDIPDFVSASTSSSGWNATAQLVGITPSLLNPSDNPALTNVTFTYTGAVVIGPVSFTGFTIVSADDGTNTGVFTAQATKNVGPDTGLTDQSLGPVTIPGGVPVPEPGSMALAISAFGFCGALRKKLRP